MIYMQGKTGQTIVILEPANLEHLRKGGLVKSPDDQHSTLILYSPDIVWTGQQIRAAFQREDGGGSIGVEELENIVAASQSRTEVHERPYHHAEMISGRKEGENTQ